VFDLRPSIPVFGLSSQIPAWLLGICLLPGFEVVVRTSQLGPMGLWLYSSLGASRWSEASIWRSAQVRSAVTSARATSRSSAGGFSPS
jgi:hypothetical protein